MTILTTTEELKTHIEAQANLKIATVRPSITTAERRGLKKYLGEALYEQLLTAYQVAGFSIAAMTDPLKELAELSQNAVANIAMSLAVSRISVSVSDGGIKRAETDALKTAYQYQEVNLRESYLTAGFDSIDDILSYLEENKTDFQNWVDSASYIDYTKYFIRSAEQFSGCYEIRNSRLTFMTVRYIMKRTEDFELKDVLGKNLFDVLKTQLNAGALTEPNKAILDDFVRPAVAMITIARGVWERALDISENGVTVSIKGSTDNNQVREAASIEKMQKMADQLMKDGNEYLKRLSEYLSENATDFPDYQAPDTERVQFEIKNDRDRGIFAV